MANYFLTEDGNNIVTENGSNIVLEDSAATGSCGEFEGQFNKLTILSRIHMVDDYDDLVCLKTEFLGMSWDTSDPWDYNWAKNHLMRELNRKAKGFGESVFFSPYDGGLRPVDPTSWI